MQAKVEVKGMYLIVLIVVIMMVGMVFLVKDMKKSSELRKKENQVAMDSLISLKFEQLNYTDSIILHNDSMTLELITLQKSEIGQLKSQVNNIKHKLNSLEE